MIRSADGGTSPEVLTASIQAIMETTRLCTLATVSSSGLPWANHNFFAYDEEFQLYFLSEPTTDHAINLTHNRAAAVAIADTQQTGDGGKRGLQLAGRCAPALNIQHALNVFGTRFRDFGLSFPTVEKMEVSGMNAIFFEFVPEGIKIFDEPRFGEETWIRATII